METVLRVLFVASGNSKSFELSPFIKAQGEKLQEIGVEIEFYPVLGHGIRGYLKNAAALRLFLKHNHFDLIHAHYMLCGWVAVIARPKIPIILSFMGDDAYGTFYKPNKTSILSRYLQVVARGTHNAMASANTVDKPSVLFVCLGECVR